MDDRTHHHGAHSHGGRVHVHASVDHLASDTGQSARLAIRLDGALMETLGVTADAVVRVATDRGRSILVRLDPPAAADRGAGTVRLDRFVRQALKARRGRLAHQAHKENQEQLEQQVRKASRASQVLKALLRRR